MAEVKKLEFQDPAVKQAYEIPTPVEKDFQVRVPKLQWSGMFSTIPLEVADQLVKEKYNHIKQIVKK